MERPEFILTPGFGETRPGMSHRPSVAAGGIFLGLIRKIGTSTAASAPRHVLPLATTSFE